MFGHHHVADDHPLVTLPNLFQHFHEQVATRGAGQPGLPPVTTECEEVQIVSAVPALQAPRHNRRLKEPLSSRCDLGHIVKVTDHENPQVSKIARPGPPGVPDPSHINSFMNFRVADIQACYELWKSRGAEFITEPIPKYGEIRCYIRDPDGYIIEVGQSTDLTYG